MCPAAKTPSTSVPKTSSAALPSNALSLDVEMVQGGTLSSPLADDDLSSVGD